MRRRATVVFVLALTLGILSALIRYGPSTGPGLALLTRLATCVEIGNVGRLRVEGLQGDPWSDFSLARLEIADRQGVWLTARGVSVSWRAGELLERRVRITRVASRSVSLLRRPIATPSRQPGGPAPVSVRIDLLDAKVGMSPQFAGRQGDYLVRAALNLGRVGGVSGRVAAVSLNHPGDYLRVGFTFKRAQIGLEAHALEARGGALAGSLGLDPFKPFILDASAHGTPRAGSFDLKTAVGAAAPAVASGRWSPGGGTASGQLDLASSVLLAGWRSRVGPSAVIKLDAAATAKGVYRVSLDARSANLLLTANGDIDPSHGRTAPTGVAITATVADLSTLADLPGLGSAKAAGRLTGEPSAWRLTGSATAEKLNVIGLSLAKLTGPFELSSKRNGVTLTMQTVGTADPRAGPLAALLGPAPRAAAQIDWLADGRTLWRKLGVHGAAIDAEGQGDQSLFGALAFNGKIEVRSLTGLAAGTRGAIAGDWRARQAKGSAPWVFDVRVRGQGVQLASAEAESLLGASPDLHIAGSVGTEGVTLERANLTGGAAAFNGAGLIGKNGDLKMKLDWATRGPVALGPLEITGASQGSGALTGALDKPRLDLSAIVKIVDLPDLPRLRLRDAHVTLAVMVDGQTVTGQLGLNAVSDDGPARIRSGFRVDPGEIALTGLDVAAGGAAVQGAGVLSKGQLVTADLTGAIGPGAFLDAGRADMRVVIANAADGPRAKLSVKGTGLAFEGGATVFDSLTVSADGPLRRLPYRFEARGASSGLASRLSGSGFLIDNRGGRSLSFTGAGRVGAADFKTLSPGEVSFQASGIAAALHLGVAQGKADITFDRAGTRLNGRAVVTGVSLAVFDPGIRGRADGVVTISGVDGLLTGVAEARVTGLADRDAEDASPMSGTFEARLGGTNVSVRAQLTDARGSAISADVDLPAVLSAAPFRLAIDSRRPMTGQFTADGQIGPVWNLLQGGGRSLTGHLVAAGRIGGTLADPRVTGAAAVNDGDFEDSAIGLRLKGLTVRAALQGDSIDVGQFSAGDGAKGEVTGNGRLSLLRGGASGFRIGLRDFRLIDNNLGQATASGSVNVDRAGDGKVRLSGALTIDRAQISPKAAAPSGVVPMAVVEINRPGDAQVSAASPTERQPPIALDIALTSPGGIFIKGRGLNLEMSLDARVTGSTATAALTGVARVVRGDYDFAGKRFQVDDRSMVHLGATAESIRLDLTATREDPTLTAVIKIAGTAAAPTLTLSSTPALPNDEVLAQVLFGASAAQLSGVEAAQLASAVAGLAGNGGFDVIGGLRSFAHLDRLAIESGAAAGFSVAGGKYLTDNVYLELSGGGKYGQGAQVEWRVRKHLSIASRVTSQGDQALSVRWRKDF